MFVVPLRKTISVLVLIFLIAVLAYIANARGLRPALGGPPAVLEGRFVKEEAWIVDEIVHDITEMAAYPTKVRGEVTIARSAEGIYRVGVGSQGPAAVDIDLREDLWAPAQFRALARATLDTAPSSAVRSNEAASPVYPALLTLTPATLVTTSAAVSRALAADMRDPDLHEAAALTLGAFALRESAERFSDMRWAMNRMTAHLTIAAALRRDAPPGIDGQLATSVLWMLANHQTRALQALDATAPDRRDEALDSWKRAVRVHLTQDRRTIAKPAGASLLEKREYFRAYRATGPWTTGLAALEQLDVAPTADWLRIIEQYGVVVSDRDVMSRMLDAERAESDEVFQRIHGRAIADWNTALNARAGRLIDASGPQVLPWGAWAEFAQRHLAMFIDRTDAFYRHTIGNEHVADTEKVRLKRQLGSLRIFPIATIFWTKGVAGGDADLGLINEAISAAVAAPELVPAAAWSFLADGSRYEPVRRSMPPPDAWFVAPAPRAPYEAGTRIRDTHARIAAVTIDSMLRGAPYDARLASEYLTVTFGARPPAAEIRRAFGPRLEYDERTLRSARTFTPEDDATERLQLAKTACELYAAECITLGYDLAAVNREADAAAAFERAFADPSLDAVALSNSSGWLVSYYYRHGRTRSAARAVERTKSGTRSRNQRVHRHGRAAGRLLERGPHRAWPIVVRVQRDESGLVHLVDRLEVRLGQPAIFGLVAHGAQR